MARTSRTVAWCVAIALGLCAAASYLIWESRAVIRYVDVHSGRIKTTVSILGATIRVSTSQTPFSRIIADSGEGSREAEWKPYWSRSFGQATSPHYRYHSAPNDLDVLVRVLRFRSCDERVVRLRCMEALRLLETGRVYELQRFVGTVEASKDGRGKGR